MFDVYHLEYPTKIVEIHVADRQWRERQPNINGKREIRTIGAVIKGPKHMLHKAAASVLAEYREFTSHDAIYIGSRS